MYMLCIKHTIDVVPLPGDHSLKLHRAPLIHSPELNKLSEKKEEQKKCIISLISATE